MKDKFGHKFTNFLKKEMVLYRGKEMLKNIGIKIV